MIKTLWVSLVQAFDRGEELENGGFVPQGGFLSNRLSVLSLACLSPRPSDGKGNSSTGAQEEINKEKKTYSL